MISDLFKIYIVIGLWYLYSGNSMGGLALLDQCFFVDWIKDLEA